MLSATMAEASKRAAYLLIRGLLLIASIVILSTSVTAQPSGWRLMVPAFDDDGRLQDESDPDRWHQLQAFDSARECEARLRKLVNEAMELTNQRIAQAPLQDGPLLRGHKLAGLTARCLPFLPQGPRFSPVEVPDSARVFQRVAGGVVMITSYGPTGLVVASGSATLVLPHVAVTNAHVVRGAGTAYATFKSGKRTWVEGVLSDNAAADLVLLRLGEPAPETTGLHLATTAPSIGERVYTLGAPSGLGWSISEGIVSGLRSHPRMGPVIQFTAPVSPGSSGGPLLNGRGEVLGIVTFAIERGQNLNFAVPVATVRTLTLPDLSVPLRKWPFEVWAPGK
jgi:S1-C subfamily serine protease